MVSSTAVKGTTKRKNKTKKKAQSSANNNNLSRTYTNKKTGKKFTVT